MMYHIALGLKSLHNNKYAHRDIKPENILITLDGSHKISDFACSTNKFYENINNNRNEIVFDISRNTTPAFRAPEQLDLYSGFPINEKVDIWALGVILYSILYEAQPFASTSENGINRIKKGDLVLSEEMAQSYSAPLIDLLRKLLKPNPRERISSYDLVIFVEQYISSINVNKNLMNELQNTQVINIKKRTYSLANRMAEYTAKLFKRHSTQFWVLKLTDENIEAWPKLKYIKYLVNKAWSKRNKIPKLYQNLSSRPVHYLSFVALKSLYVIHHYIYLGPHETMDPSNFGFLLDEFINSFSNLWNTRYQTDNYDKDESLKNSNVTKFVVNYAEFLKVKIAYHKKYSYIENNYSIEQLLTKNFDFSLLVDKKFITDTISLYSLVYQKLVQIPIIVKQISNTIDMILQIFNEELISLFNFIFYVLIAFKNYNSPNINKNENLLKVFDSQFLEITNKSREYIEKFKKFRSEIKSKNVLLSFPGNSNESGNIVAEYFKNLDNNLKFFPSVEFNIKGFMGSSKDLIGVKLNRNIGKLIEQNLFFDKRENERDFNNNTSFSDDEKPPISPTKDIINQINNINTNRQSVGSSNIINGINGSYNNSNQMQVITLGNVNSSNQVATGKNKKDFEFSDEKFVNTNNNFEFDTKRNTALNKQNNYATKESLNNARITPNNDNLSLFGDNTNMMIQMKERVDKSPIRANSMHKQNSEKMITNLNFAQNNKNNNNNMEQPKNNTANHYNNNQSLFNVNFFSKSNVPQNNNNNNAVPLQNKIDDSYFTAYSNVYNDNNINNNMYPNSNTIRKFSGGEQEVQLNTTNVLNALNQIFESNKNEMQINTLYPNQQNEPYDTNKFKRVLNDMDKKVSTIQNNIYPNANNTQSNFNPNYNLQQDYSPIVNNKRSTFPNNNVNQKTEIKVKDFSNLFNIDKNENNNNKKKYARKY